MWTSISESIIASFNGASFGQLEFYERILWLIAKYGPSYATGLYRTMVIALISTAIGCVIGLAVGVVQTIPLTANDNPVKKFFVKLIKLILNIYVEVFRGTPMMIQAVFIYYGAAQLYDIYMGMMTSAIFIVSVNTGAYMAETVRGGIMSIDPGQTEGAKAIGMTHVQTMLYVIMPQTLRNIMPQIGNNLIINIKDTCVLSVIGVVELFYAHKSAAGATYDYFGSAAIVMFIYLCATFLCSRVLRVIERRMDGQDSFDLATTDTLAHTTGMTNYPVKGSPFDERNIEKFDEFKGGE